jgi:hypothetical protein
MNKAYFSLLVILICATSQSVAQTMNKSYTTLQVHAGFAPKLTLFSASVLHHITISKKKAYFLIGVRSNTSRYSGNLEFSPPVNNGPQIIHNQQSLTIFTMAIATGFKWVLTPKLSLNVVGELFNAAAGNKLVGTFNHQQVPYTYDASIVSSGFVLNDLHQSNFQHTIELGYLLTESLKLKAGYCKYNVGYNFTTSLPTFSNFKQGTDANAAILGVEWLIK